jgi:hypothetical protein
LRRGRLAGAQVRARVAAELAAAVPQTGRLASCYLVGTAIQPATSSFSPSTTCASTSGVQRPRRPPTRSTESVRIWLILIHERLGSFGADNSSASGKPARPNSKRRCASGCGRWASAAPGSIAQ